MFGRQLAFNVDVANLLQSGCRNRKLAFNLDTKRTCSFEALKRRIDIERVPFQFRFLQPVLIEKGVVPLVAEARIDRQLPPIVPSQFGAWDEGGQPLRCQTGGARSDNQHDGARRRRAISLLVPRRRVWGLRPHPKIATCGPSTLHRCDVKARASMCPPRPMPAAPEVSATTRCFRSSIGSSSITFVPASRAAGRPRSKSSSTSTELDANVNEPSLVKRDRPRGARARRSREEVTSRACSTSCARCSRRRPRRRATSPRRCCASS